ncbi:indole-3-glycerol phosphate synthase TrpC [Alkaliphilus peptidifermentans]|uniref:Indole-3-glycerol phosphate synthase n=1 Tax=Alkaliphilus peptidifermentans DSM 18978 TaxID=1120976 RepID=A0A1G5JRS5_9FIRM|nr:indole-3-glycerol phosphate synthase TrpC [Alkaliphilus peptidifermentans]SCY90379.1 indole-3-glycerol phosphate synthase [Alkaliphilus peptidifermentans DSM 18978]
MILDRLVTHKIKRLKEQKEHITLNEIKEQVLKLKKVEDTVFAKAISEKEGIAVIAEVKKASPSKGIISEEFDYLKIALDYEVYGASAISVLTEEDFFLGSPKYLTEIKGKVNIPVLRKDFIIDEYQIYESKLLGANSILLITGILNDVQLRSFFDVANRLKMDCLVEVHNEAETKQAIDIGAKMIGINNRDLRTFYVDLKTSERLVKLIPEDIIKVSESGIKSINDIKRLHEIGFNAVLIGEALMKANSVKEKLKELHYSGEDEENENYSKG